MLKPWDGLLQWLSGKESACQSRRHRPGDQSLVLGAPVCHKATKPMSHNYGARTLEPWGQDCGACALRARGPGLLSPPSWLLSFWSLNSHDYWASEDCIPMTTELLKPAFPWLLSFWSLHSLELVLCNKKGHHSEEAMHPSKRVAPTCRN